MKQVLFSLCVCLSLSACEAIPTLSDVENYDWSKLNPLSQSEPVQEVEFANGAAIPGQNPSMVTSGQQQAALQTELQEIQTLTGGQPTVAPNAHGRIPVSAVIGTAPQNAQTSAARPQIFMAPTATPAVPAVFPVKKPVVRPSGNIVANASITQTAPAIAAPQGAVTSAPTADSIRWNQPAPASKQVSAIPAPAPTIQQTQTTQATVPVAQAQANPAMQQPAAIKGCPRLEIMPVARSMTNFKGDTVNGQMTSRGSIVDVRGGCEAVKGGLQIDLTIIMKGAITTAGRFNNDSNLEAFITFPYFVSVTSPSGDPIDKTIKATAFRFKPKVDLLDHAEQISQFIPMDKVSAADRYLVTVGFQLSRKQLEYNNAQTMLQVNNTRNTPDMPAARQKSLNPFAN